MKANHLTHKPMLIATLAMVLVFLGVFQAVHPLSHIAAAYSEQTSDTDTGIENNSTHSSLCSHCLLVSVALAVPIILIRFGQVASRSRRVFLHYTSRQSVNVFLPAIRAPPVKYSA